LASPLAGLGFAQVSGTSHKAGTTGGTRSPPAPRMPFPRDELLDLRMASAGRCPGMRLTAQAKVDFTANDASRIVDVELTKTSG